MRDNKERCEKELFIESYFGITGVANECDPINTDYGQLVNLLAMYNGHVRKQIEEEQVNQALSQMQKLGFLKNTSAS